MEPKLVGMPYINLKTTAGNFPFLIDTGANINLINPQLAYGYKSSKPYKFQAHKIGSANGNFNATAAIDINFFFPKIDYTARFILHKFHSFFHGILGTDILNALNSNINLEDQTLNNLEDQTKAANLHYTDPPVYTTATSHQ